MESSIDFFPDTLMSNLDNFPALEYPKLTIFPMHCFPSQSVFLNGLLLCAHLFQKGLVGFLPDHPREGFLVVLDNADAVNGHIFHKPPLSHGSQRIIDRNLFVHPDDDRFYACLVLIGIFFGVQNFFPAQKIKDELRVGILKKILKNSIEF